jgi:hypothetical protein
VHGRVPPGPRRQAPVVSKERAAAQRRSSAEGLAEVMNAFNEKPRN